MQIRVRGVYTKHKALSSGAIAKYIYHRKTNARIHALPGTADFLIEVERLNRGPKVTKSSPQSMMALFERYKALGHFGALAKPTRDEHARAIRELEPMIGAFQALDIGREHITQIRDKLAKARLGPMRWCGSYRRL